MNATPPSSPHETRARAYTTQRQLALRVDGRYVGSPRRIIIDLGKYDVRVYRGPSLIMVAPSIDAARHALRSDRRIHKILRAAAAVSS